MAEELKYRISFTKGSLTGQLFPLGPESVIVGRSHTCGIRVMEPDVSGRHVMLAVGPKGVEMEVISSRRTVLDGKVLKTGDRVAVRAGQGVAMGGSVEFAVECYRTDGDRTEAPSDWAGGIPHLGGDDATRRPESPRGANENGMLPADGDHGGGPSSGLGDDDDTGTHIPPSPAPRAARPPQKNDRRPPPPADPASTGTVGTLAMPPPPPPPPSGGETLGTEALQPSPDATQILRTRAATPQEMAYMRELHSKKQRRKTGLRLVLGGLLVVAAIVVYAVWNRPIPFSVTSERKKWKVVDANLQPIPIGGASDGNGSLFWSYPPSPWGMEEDVRTGTNAALRVVETVFTAKTRVGAKREIPLQLKLVVYASAESLHQSLEESFADWEKTNGLGLEKQSRLGVDFFGANPGIPCVRYTYTRKATRAEEEAGVSDWAGVMSFFRLRDTCFVYFREVPGVEGLRTEPMMLRTAIFLGIDAGLVQERWSGMPPDRQYRGELHILRNSVRELMDKNMDNEWEEVEDKLSTILIRTFPGRDADADTGRLYREALGWMRILRERQTETWKTRCVSRYLAERDGREDARQIDDEVRALFRSPMDRRHQTVQKDKWWLVP